MIYAVVCRMTRQDDNVYLFSTKQKAKDFIKQSLQDYINAHDSAIWKKSWAINSVDNVESYVKSNGKNYSVLYGVCDGNYVCSASLLEKDVL